MISKKNYKKRIENLKARRQDTLTKAIIVSEAFNKSTYGETIKYVYESMQEIDPKYTARTYEICDKIKGHLTSGLKETGISVQFDYQGSVPTNTHIRLHSDIDLLTVHYNFYSLEPPQVPTFPYYGDTVQDLKNMREKVHIILDSVYSACTIDNSGSKALSISGGSLQRKVDLVICNWYDSVNYTQTLKKFHRGIQVLDRDNSRRILNYPFAHIENLNNKDTQVLGNLKRLIRFLKTLKIDAKEESGVDIKLSSYDLASLIYRMDNSELMLFGTKRLQLLNNCRDYFNKIISDSSFRESLEVVNNTRKIFCDDGAKVEDLVKLKSELDDIIADILVESKPIFDTLEKAEINYL